MTQQQFIHELIFGALTNLKNFDLSPEVTEAVIAQILLNHDKQDVLLYLEETIENVMDKKIS